MDRWRKGAHIDLAYARRGRHICDPAPVGRERRVRIRELALQELLRLARLQLQGATQCLWSDVSLLHRGQQTVAGASGLIGAGPDHRLHGHGRVGLCLHCISPFLFRCGHCRPHLLRRKRRAGFTPLREFSPIAAADCSGGTRTDRSGWPSALGQRWTREDRFHADGAEF